jgi:tetratricopeptide (TPR) repeat protein
MVDTDTQWLQLKQRAEAKTAHLLPNHTFQQYDDPNTRLLVAVTCMRVGDKDLAYELFATVAAEGPQENANHHFAYVRSLVEMAEIDAERGDFALAEQHMSEALAAYPESMGYMMSRVHLEVYLTYYRFQLGRQEEAIGQLKTLIERERRRFTELPQADGPHLVGPGLCYAIHQLALFYAERNDWPEAVRVFREVRSYAWEIDEGAWQEADRLAERGDWQAALEQYVSATNYASS